MPTSQNPGSNRRDAGRNRRAERAAAQRRKQLRTRYALGGIGVVVIVVVIIIVIAVTGGGGGGDRQAAPASVVQKVTSVTTADLAASVKQASANASASSNGPTPITTPALTADGKPQIVYLGGEFCPFCAADRWVTVIALAQFGQWHNLKVTHSTSTDVDPNTPTFSFYGATYTSKYLTWSGYEVEDRNQKKLETAPKALSNLPLTVAATVSDATLKNSLEQGQIPFMDIGGKFVQSGAPYDPAILANKSWQDVADALHTPASPIYQAVLPAAAELVQDLCTLTNNQPANVCSALATSSSTTTSTTMPAGGATTTTQPDASKLTTAP